MEKLVTIKLAGNLAHDGFQVTLEIAKESQFPAIQIDPFNSGRLPANPELSKYLNNWETNYRLLTESTRFKNANPLINRLIDSSLGILTRSIQPKQLQGSRISRKKQIILCNKAAIELSEYLKIWLDSEAFLKIDKILRTNLDKEDKIRVLIRTNDLEIYKLPWHEWDLFKDYPQAEYAIGSLNYQRIEKINLPPKKEEKVRILVILGNSNQINTEKDRELLANLPNTEPVFLVEKSRQEIIENLLDKSWDILFFAGHSETKDGKGRIYINKQDSLTIDELNRTLTKTIANGLQIAIFNSCDGLGLAQQLGDLNIPQMIFMQQPVPDLVAQHFLKYFLQVFSGGSSLYLAIKETRANLEGLQDRFPQATWLPVIWQNAAEVPPTWKKLRTGGRIASHEWDNLKQDSVVIPNNDILISKSGHKFYWHTFFQVLSISLGITFLVVGMRSQGYFQELEFKALDHFMQRQPVIESTNPNLFVIKITVKDLEKLGKKPEEAIPDATVVQILEKLNQYQPRVIGLDIGREASEGMKRTTFGEKLKQYKNLIGICKVPDSSNLSGSQAPPGIPSEGLGFSDHILDKDFVIRRYLWKMKPEGLCPSQYSFSFQLVLKYLETQNIKHHISLNGNLEFINTKSKYKQIVSVFRQWKPYIGGYQQIVPKLDLGGYQILMKYPPYDRLESIAPSESIEDILAEGRNLTKSVKDRIVLIGYEDDDYQKTPYGKLSRVFIDAQFISQIIRTVLDKSPNPVLTALPGWGDSLFIVTVATIAGIVTFKMRSQPYLIFATGAILIILLYEFCFVVFTRGFWLPLIPSAVALLLTVFIIIPFIPLSRKRHQ